MRKLFGHLQMLLQRLMNSVFRAARLDASLSDSLLFTGLRTLSAYCLQFIDTLQTEIPSPLTYPPIRCIYIKDGEGV